MTPRHAPRSATVFAQALGLAVVTASQRDGAAPPDVCARIGLDPAILGSPDARIPHDDLCRAWTALSAADESFGLRAAILVDAAPQSLVEYTFSSAGDVRAAMRAFVRFQRLIHDASAHTLDEGPAYATFNFALSRGYALPLAIWDYLAATMVLRFRRVTSPSHDPAVVCLPRPRLHDDAIARGVFRAPIEYSQSHARIQYPRAFLDARMSTTDPTLFALLAQQLERALGLPEGEHRVLPRAGDDLLARVRRELRTAIPRGEATLDHVARAVGQSARSLQRRLSDRGTSFQAIVDDARRAMAEELLSAHRATVTEAAFAVGFADVAAFTRAFRRWTGVPPGEWSRSR